jgi:hypothetical protein
LREYQAGCIEAALVGVVARVVKWHWLYRDGVAKLRGVTGVGALVRINPPIGLYPLKKHNGAKSGTGAGSIEADAALKLRFGAR